MGIVHSLSVVFGWRPRSRAFDPRWDVFVDRCASGDRQPVPAVEGDDRERQPTISLAEKARAISS